MTLTEKLNALMEEKGINRKQLSEQSKIPYMTIVNFYEKGTENVKLSTLKKLAAYFCVSLDYIADDSIKEKSPAPAEAEAEELTKGEHILIDNYRSLNDDGKIAAQDSVEALTYVPKYKKYSDSKNMA